MTRDDSTQRQEDGGSGSCFSHEFMDTLKSSISRRVPMKRSHWLIGSALTLALAASASGCVVRARPPPVDVRGGVTVQGISAYPTVYQPTFAPEPIPEYRPAPPGYG